MRMQKGICMELNGDHSVYMLADGSFVTGRPTVGTLVGEETYFVPSEVSNRRFNPLAMPLIASVAALFLLISTWMLPADEAYGYVQVESNPGIEIGMDGNWHVISLRYLNEDGKRLIAKLSDWKNEDFEAVLKNVLDLSVNKDTEQVTITTVQEGDGADAMAIVEQIALAALFTGNNQELQIHLKEANKKQWRKAKEQQLPVARLIEKDRTFTSPHNKKSDVQPAQNEGIRENKAPAGQDVPSKAQEPELPKVQLQNQPASTSTDKAEKSQKPDIQSNPVPEKKPSSEPKKPAEKTPEAQQETKKTELPEPAKPKNPNAGKGNNSGNVKAETKPKKETPSSEKSKAEKPKQDSKSKGNPVPGKPKNQGDRINKGNGSDSNNSSKADKGKTTNPKD